MLRLRAFGFLLGNGSAVLFFQNCFRIIYPDRSTESSSLLFSLRCRSSLIDFVLVYEIQVQSEEQKIKRKEVRDFTDTSFHNIGFFGFQILPAPEFSVSDGYQVVSQGLKYKGKHEVQIKGKAICKNQAIIRSGES